MYSFIPYLFYNVSEKSGVLKKGRSWGYTQREQRGMQSRLYKDSEVSRRKMYQYILPLCLREKHFK